MKKKFSLHWKGSTQARKQRKYAVHAPLHIKGAQLSAHLSKELRKKYGERSARVCVGDKVKVMRGQFKKKSGKVERVNMKRSVIFITGIEHTRKDGSRVLYPVAASKVLIEESKTDRRRFTEQKVGK